jgi:hypothetical protein
MSSRANFTSPSREFEASALGAERVVQLRQRVVVLSGRLQDTFLALGGERVL